jgi:hypothetical protein
MSSYLALALMPTVASLNLLPFFVIAIAGDKFRRIHRPVVDEID